MPKAFDRCVKAGGRVRKKKLSGGRSINICFKDGKSYAGHVEKRSYLSEALEQAKKGRKK
jgi:putative hemolysin